MAFGDDNLLLSIISGAGRASKKSNQFHPALKTSRNVSVPSAPYSLDAIRQERSRGPIFALCIRDSPRCRHLPHRLFRGSPVDKPVYERKIVSLPLVPHIVGDKCLGIPGQLFSEIGAGNHLLERLR